MPLRFRSVVPYTLPGVLALIGWWWYISRKKDRLISHDSPSAASTSLGCVTSTTEESNGLVEKGAAPPTSETEGPVHIPSKGSDQAAEHEDASRLHAEANTGTFAPVAEHSSEDAAYHQERIRKRDAQESFPTLSWPQQGSSHQVFLKDPQEESSSPASVQQPEDDLKGPVLAEAPMEVASTFPPAVHLSDAERPEQEEDVEVVECAFTTASLQEAIPLNAESEPLLVQDLPPVVLTSTPNFSAPSLDLTALTTTSALTTTPAAPEDIQAHSGGADELDLELLASGLISEVISAATQEILGVSGCQVSVSSSSSSSRSPLGADRLCSSVTPQQHQLPAEREAAEQEEEQGLQNGCVPLTHTLQQPNRDQRGHWPTTGRQTPQSAPLLSASPREDAASTLDEDSACTSCHSRDGVSGQDLQRSVFENQTDVIQITDFSAQEATHTQSAADTSEEKALAETAEDSVDALCEIKRLNGMGLRNGAHGTCEVETDQSGGEMLFIRLFWQVRRCLLGSF